MRLGVPFIAPRQLGAVESNSGRLILPSVIGRTGQSGAHRTLSGARFVSSNSTSDRCCLSQICALLAHRTCPVHTGQSGVSFRPLARPRVACRSRGRPLARPTVGSPDSPVHTFRPLARPRVAHRFRGRPLAHRTVRCTPDSPVNFSRTSSANSRERPVRSSQPGAPDSPVC